jgi:hypothetical protein
MIIARVEGGLGNQMFIYAAARALALRTGNELKLDILNGYDQDAFGRRYQLDAFRIAATLASETEVRRFRRESWSLYWRRKLNRRLPFALRSLIEERSLYEPRLLAFRPRGSVYLIGYWQREEYFRDQADAIRREFTLRTEPSAEDGALAERLRLPDAVILHVRRRNYEHRLPAEYYAAALRLLASRVARPKLFVFGDDLDWARRSLRLPEGAQFVEHHSGGRDCEDLWLMSQCRHAIIANSSFSWWGAWLNPQSDRIVIAPSEWGYRAAPVAGWLTVSADSRD